jgi:hypothetical protein
MTDEPDRLPDPAAVMANRAALMRGLRVLLRPYRNRVALQSQYVVALGAFTKYLAAEGAKDEALKILGLADAIGQLKNGTVADVLRPTPAGGRSPDGIMVWSLRAEVDKGLECFLRSRKFKTQEKAAKYIADKYSVVFNRLKRTPKASLARSILSWRRRINEGDVPEEAEDVLAHRRDFFEQHGGENRSPAEMFALGEELLAQAAERTTKSVF